MFEEWCKTFDPEQHKGEISELLVNVPEIRALYAKLVGTCTVHVSRFILILCYSFGNFVLLYTHWCMH